MVEPVSFLPRHILKEEVEQNATEYKYSFPLEGWKKKDLKVSVENHSIIIQGEKSFSINNFLGKQKGYSKEMFYRSIAVIEGMDVDNLTAKFEGDILTITIPKNSASSAYRKIALDGVSNEAEVVSDSKSLWNTLKCKLKNLFS